VREPLFAHKHSVLHSNDYRQLPQWLCYETIVRSGDPARPLATMRNLTPVDPSLLAPLSLRTPLLALGKPLPAPLPRYDPAADRVLGPVEARFGERLWPVAPLLRPARGRDSFRWFARLLLEGKILPGTEGLPACLKDDPCVVTRKHESRNVLALVGDLVEKDVRDKARLVEHWATRDDKFLFRRLKEWTKEGSAARVKKMWADAVQSSVASWRETNA